MREPREILARLRALRTTERELGARSALVTIVAAEGPTYRREGARMLIESGAAESPAFTGVLSGGCVERAIAELAAEVAASGSSRVTTYDLTGDDDAIWGFGLGCPGRLTLLLEPVLGSAGDAVERALAAAIEDRRHPHVATVFRTFDNGPEIGERHLWFREAEATEDKQGHSGNEGNNDQGKEDWRRLSEQELAAWSPGTARSVVLLARDGSSVEVLLESLAPPLRLLILGAERDIVPLARLASEMGWEVLVVDGRGSPAIAERFRGSARVVVAPPRSLFASGDVALDARTAVVVATHRYLDDLAYLAELAALRESFGYLGLLGPERRRARLLADLDRNGLRIDSARLRGPAGLALGGRAPEEVALAIVAEIQATFAGGSGGALTRPASGTADELVGVAPRSSGTPSR